jgi:hypothetical protein
LRHVNAIEERGDAGEPGRRLSQRDASLERLIFIQGGAAYGARLGVYKTPAREDDSRHFPPNLYFRHEDFARSLEGEGLRWTALRPDIVIGRSLGSATNLGNLIGLYGALRRETRTAIQFPGPDAAYRDALVNVTGGAVLGEASPWAAEANADGALNITNGWVRCSLPGLSSRSARACSKLTPAGLHKVASATSSSASRPTRSSTSPRLARQASPA